MKIDFDFVNFDLNLIDIFKNKDWFWFRKFFFKFDWKKEKDENEDFFFWRLMEFTYLDSFEIHLIQFIFFK